MFQACRADDLGDGSAEGHRRYRGLGDVGRQVLGGWGRDSIPDSPWSVLVFAERGLSPLFEEDSQLKLFTGLVLSAAFVANAFSAVLRVPEDFIDIQSAVDAAVDGDTVDVAPGTYTLSQVDTAEPTLRFGISIGKAITVRSRELYQATLAPDDPGLILIRVKGAAHIEGFVLENARAGVYYRIWPQQTSGSFNWSARNLILRNMALYGIASDDVQHTGFGEISNVVIDNCNRALVTDNTIGLRLRNSIIVNNDKALRVNDHLRFEVDHSLFFNNGVLVEESEFCLPTGTHFCDVTLGDGVIQGVDPLLFEADVGGRVFPSFPSCGSPVVDAGDPDTSFDDRVFPPSLGTERNDLGAYGGPAADLALTTVESAELLQQAGCAPVFDCAGFDAPLAAGPVKVQHLRVLPLKARLLDAYGAAKTDLDLATPPVVQVLFTAPGEDEAIDVTDEALPAGQGDEGNQFAFSGDRWRFNLKTKPYSAPGTYRIELVAGDPFEYGVNSCRVDLAIE